MPIVGRLPIREDFRDCSASAPQRRARLLASCAAPRRGSVISSVAIGSMRAARTRGNSHAQQACRGDDQHTWFRPVPLCKPGRTVAPPHRTPLRLCAYRLSHTKIILPTRACGSTGLSVFLGTSLAQRSGYAGGQVFITHAFRPGGTPLVSRRCAERWLLWLFTHIPRRS
jgi:hypothetical protein